MKKLFKNLMPMLLLVAGLGISPNAWAYYVQSLSIYYDNSVTQYGDVAAIWGKSDYSQAHHLNNIPNTALWYNTWNDKWDGYTDFRFLWGDKNWSGAEGKSPYERASNFATNKKYTGCVYNVNLTGAQLFKGASADANCTLNRTALSNGYSDLNKKQTVKVMVKATEQSAYVETTTFCGTITASRYTMTNASTAGSSSKTLSSDNYASGVLTSTISFTESNTTAGFTFKGWGTSSGSPATTDHTYSYTVDGEKTIYVFYEFDINVLQATTKSDYYLHTWGDGGDQGKDFYKTQLAKFYIIDNGNDPIDFTSRNGFGFKNGGTDGSWKGGEGKTIANGNTWYSGVYNDSPSSATNGLITKANMTYVSYVYFYYDGSDASTSAIYLAKGYKSLSVTKTPSAGSASDPTISKNYVTQGQSVDVTAKTAASGYHFVNWTSSKGSFDDDEEMSTTFTPTANNAQAVANYEKNNYSLSYTGSNIASCNLPSTGTFEEVITVNVTAESRYVITEINGVTATDITGLNTQSVSFKFAVPASDVQISFTTALGQVNLNYGINDEDHGTLGATIDSKPVSSGSKIDGGSDVYFTATVDAGYHIEGWYSDDQYGAKIDESVALTRTVKANDDVNVYVKVLPNTYKVAFNQNTGSGTTMNNQNFTYDVAQTLTSNTYTKTGYRFLGWNVSQSAATAQYTDGQSVSNLTTVNGGTVTLYAIWEQKMYNDIAVASNSTDKGTVNQSSVSFGYTTPSASITATPKAGYYFTGWTLPANATYASGDEHNPQITVKASGDAAVSGTITANFAERWGLVGSLEEDGNPQGGMPGWTDANAAIFTVNNGNITLDLTLEPNKTYKFQIYDKKLTKRHGCTATGEPAVIKVGNSWTLNEDKNVRLRTVGHGTYTFTIDNTTADPTDPKISYTAPISHLINMGPKTDKGDGGTITAVDGDNFTISDGKYVKNGGSVTFTATPKTGYSFAGFYDNAECNGEPLCGTSPYTINDIITGQTVYAKFTENLTDVTVFDGVNTTTVQAGVYTHPQITAQQIDGKKFTGWQVEGVTVENSAAKSTNINSVITTVNTHKVTATYGDLDAIYFDLSKCSEWNPTCMYVYFYWGEYWTDAKGTGTDTGGKYTGTRLQMQQVNLGNNKFWVAYYDGAEIGGDGGISTIQRVAFADKEQNGGDFTSCTISYMVFNSCMNMCVLSNNNKKSPTDISSACYRNEGFWKNYDANNSGLYLKIEGKSDEMIDQKISADTYSKSIHLDPESTGDTYLYYFYIAGCNGQVYSNEGTTITKDSPSEVLVRHEQDPSITKKKVTLYATTPGSYVFTVKHTMEDKLEVTVEYPVSEGDYRVISVINDDAHDNGYIYKHSSTAKDDLASFFVKTGMTVNLQKCTHIDNTNITWENVAGQSISNFTANGYHNFKIHQDGNGTATLTDEGEYQGNFYLRTDVAPGGWSNYLTNAGNIMQENEYGTNDAQSFKFTHAYTNHVGHGGNVKFVIANDYSKCISDTLVKDDFITSDAGDLPSGKDANVRFMWNKNTNEIKRAYIGGSANTSDRYLILLGNKEGDKSLMVDEKGVAFPEGGDGRTRLNADEAIFKDLGNWVYQVNIKAFSGAAVKLMADFNGETQYFVGAAEGGNAWRTIMAGDETVNPYAMRAVYDFKSNRLVAGFVPDETNISSQIVLNGDLLILREEQESAKQIKFGEAAELGKTPSISAIDHIYCGLQINKSTMIGAKNSDYAKTMFWISFPFDVKINEIFGVGDYGRKWIIQKYNGKKRADIGWFKGDGTETFWEFMEYDETLNAYEGYLFMIDATYFDETIDEVWQIASVENVTFYFPSANGNQGIIQQDTYEQPVNSYECKIDRPFANDPNKNHKVTDSYWSVIGVPVFQDAKAGIPETATFKSYYAWDSEHNTYNTATTLDGNQTFKTMHAYMVQFGGTLTWSNVSVVSKPTTAPYRYTDEKNYMIELFFNGNDAEDHTYINLADEASTDFVLNEDMMKIDNAGFPNIYSFAGNYNVAYNETKMDNQTVMLGVSAPKDGNYTFSMPKDFSGTAKLVDLVEGITTDLNVANYSVDLNKGTYNNRFQLILEVEAKTPTSIEADGQRGREADGKTTKILRNGEIYLINGGRVYNATGAELQ